jgi:Ser/Thr protein kinase RdoA (MazF antagonist)
MLSTTVVNSDNSVGLINVDPGMHNVLWHQTGPGLIDFNDSGVGPYAFCLARLRFQVVFEQLERIG